MSAAVLGTTSRHRMAENEGPRFSSAGLRSNTAAIRRPVHQVDVGLGHFSEVVVPVRDVRNWGKTGSGQRWG
jgi:hypothetical protein